MGLDERVHRVAVPDRVDDRAAGVAERDRASAGSQAGGEALVCRRGARVGAPAEKKERFDNKTS